MMTPQKKIYFASDAHLGASAIKDKRAHEQKLVSWLDSIKHDAAAVYLMGDIFDFWFEYKKVIPKGFTRFLGKLAELTDSGIEVHWFIGNHDIWIFDYIPNELGVTMHYKPEVVTLRGKRFFLAHGDGLADKSVSFRILRRLFHSKFCQKLLATIHPRWAIAFGHAWSNHSRETIKHRKYQGEENEFLICFAKEYLVKHPEIQYFVFGHRHIVLDIKLAADSRAIILGDWVSQFSYAVFDGEDIRLEYFGNKHIQTEANASVLKSSNLVL